MVAPIAHQNGKARSAIRPKTPNVVQKTFRCTNLFYARWPHWEIDVRQNDNS